MGLPEVPLSTGMPVRNTHSLSALTLELMRSLVDALNVPEWQLKSASKLAQFHCVL
jgi:hypothetical protein